MANSRFKIGGDDLKKKAQFKTINGKNYWRVTSVLGLVNPPSYVVTDDELEQYAARGSLIHLEAQLLLGHGISLNEKREYEAILAKGSLKLTPIDPSVVKSFIAQFPEFKWDEARTEETMWDDAMGICGTPDLIMPKGMNRQMMICDWKTASSYGKDKRELYFKQMAAYSLMLPEKEQIKGFYIFPLNPKNARGWGEPIFTNEVVRYQNEFLADLLKFQSLTK